MPSAVSNKEKNAPLKRRARPVENTKRAQAAFHNAVKALPGVLRVERRSGRIDLESSFIIYIRRGDVEAEGAVYDLELKTYQQFPTALLDVRVMGEVTNIAATQASGISEK